ncbi:MAG: outer membrane protein assembly factor BamB family protein [Planctomycetota bacterium]
MTIRLNSLLMLSLAVALSAGSSARADLWPQFRGATGSGVSKETNLPAKWSAGSGVVWKTELPGFGNSSPAVTDKHVVLSTQTKDDALWVLILDRVSGRIAKKIRVGSGKLAAKGPANLYAHRHNAATPSPIAIGNHIWTFFGTGLLVCVDATSGDIVWKKDMVSDYGDYDITFGMGSTPRYWNGLLYVSCLTKGASYVVALDAKTGKEKWKADRRLPAKDDGPDAYSTPIVAGNELLISGSDHVNAYDLLTGKQLWVTDGLTIDSPYGRVIASPVPTEEGIVIAASGNPGGGGKGRVIAVNALGQKGNVSSKRIWTQEKSSPDSSTPVAVDGLVFMLADNGILTCADVRTGDVKYTKRLAEGPYHASLVAADGKVYAQSTTGTCTVIKADDSGDVLAENKLDGQFFSTPAISNGVVFLRAYERIFAISK